MPDEDEMESASKYDDRPPIDVSALPEEQRDAAVGTDRSLGALEVTATQARNVYRDLVRTDDEIELNAFVGHLAHAMRQIQHNAGELADVFDDIERGFREIEESDPDEG